EGDDVGHGILSPLPLSASGPNDLQGVSVSCRHYSGGRVLENKARRIAAMTASQSHVDDPHLLVVDDDERLRGLLHRYLSGNGYRVTAAADAADARALMKSMAFDLLVLDVMMPGETGFDLTKAVRAQQSQVPILILTARGDAEDRIAGFEYGADDYLPKPFEPRELLLRVNALLRRATPFARAAHAEVRMGEAVYDPESG